MAKIVSIATALPPYRHAQDDILKFMSSAYPADETEQRKLRFLYRQSGIEARYSFIPDYSIPQEEWVLYPPNKELEPFPSLETRMQWFDKNAWKLSQQAIEACLEKTDFQVSDITHFITVSCTGLSAPGLELQIMEAMGFASNINRTAINFMGCYAAIHGLKQANDIARANPSAKVLVVCTELCTLHFQKDYSEDSVTSAMLFGDGSAAVLVTGNDLPMPGARMDSFYSEILWSGKKDMAWNLSSTGFRMQLSGYVPELVKQDLAPLKEHALEMAGLNHEDIKYWCIHPGGKRILQAVSKSLNLEDSDLACSYKVLHDVGNVSSATILFVLNELWDNFIQHKDASMFGAAFGPGLTMESVVMTSV